MYTKPIIYKIYSIVIFVVAIISFVSAIITAVLGGAMLSRLLPNGSSLLYTAVIVTAALLSLFLAYVEFSSMFTFARMIEHEESGANVPFRRPAIALPGKFYKVFGSVMFYIPLVVDFIAIIVLVISYSVTKHAFLAIPIIPIVAMLLTLFLSYITYYCRYHTFGDLLELKNSGGESVRTINSLSENKPNVLRGYCIFLYILAIISFVALIVALFFIAQPLALLVGTGLTVLICTGIVIYAIVLFMIYGIIGCYYDNLAKMLEHYMIEYKLI